MYIYIHIYWDREPNGLDIKIGCGPKLKCGLTNRKGGGINRSTL